MVMCRVSARGVVDPMNDSTDSRYIKVLKLFYREHCEPSIIDRMLFLPAGAAHDMIIYSWKHIQETEKLLRGKERD